MLAALALLPVLAQTPLVERISIDHFGSQQIGNANYVDLSADGRFVVFQDSGQLTASDTNAYPDCYLLDRTTGLLELVSLD